jgi:ferredoxin-nitrite reductase
MNIEEIKQRKDGLDVLADIYRYAKLGHQAITPEDEALFRWYGIYTQRPAADGYFMVRLRMPGGDLTAEQLREIAALSNEHGCGLADVTVRQNIQLHWVRVESLPYSTACVASGCQPPKPVAIVCATSSTVRYRASIAASFTTRRR